MSYACQITHRKILTLIRFIHGLRPWFFRVQQKQHPKKFLFRDVALNKKQSADYWTPAKAVVPARVIAPVAARDNETVSVLTPLSTVLRVAVIAKEFAATAIP